MENPKALIGGTGLKSTGNELKELPELNDRFLSDRDCRRLIFQYGKFSDKNCPFPLS